MVENTHDLVGEIVAVPEVGLEAVMKDFTDPGLAADDCRGSAKHGLHGNESERLADARHHEHIGHLVRAGDVVTRNETWKQEVRSKAELGRAFDHPGKKLAAACDDEKRPRPYPMHA